MVSASKYKQRIEESTSSMEVIKPHIIENKNVVLIDDVLFPGRTVRSGLDALLAFGRPNRVELLTFIDRRFERHLPIQPDYSGKTVDTLSSQRVSVEWKEVEGMDQVILFTETEQE